MGVFMTTGSMTATLTPNGASSRLSPSLKASAANFEQEYAAMVGMTRTPAVLVMFTMAGKGTENKSHCEIARQLCEYKGVHMCVFVSLCGGLLTSSLFLEVWKQGPGGPHKSKEVHLHHFPVVLDVAPLNHGTQKYASIKWQDRGARRMRVTLQPFIRSGTHALFTSPSRPSGHASAMSSSALLTSSGLVTSRMNPMAEGAASVSLFRPSMAPKQKKKREIEWVESIPSR